MKIKLFGADFFLGQLPRIREALLRMGHEITDQPDLIYCNDLDHALEALKFKNDNSTAKLILNVLDIPKHCWNRQNYERAKEILLKADIITSISKSTASAVKKDLGLDSQVIYNPIKDVEYRNLPKTVPFLYVGRANDPNKRFDLVKSTILELGVKEESLIIIGPDNPQFGNYLGIVDDDTLCELYNKSMFTFLPSELEGIGLPNIESLCCCCIPILNINNPCSLEFSPEFATLPNTRVMASFVDHLYKNHNEYQKYIFQKYTYYYKEKFNKYAIAQNIINLYDKISI